VIRSTAVEGGTARNQATNTLRHEIYKLIACLVVRSLVVSVTTVSWILRKLEENYDNRTIEPMVAMGWARKVFLAHGLKLR